MLTTRMPRFMVLDSVKVVYILTGLPPVFLEGSCSACHHKGMYVGHVSAAPLCVYGMLVQPLYLQTILNQIHRCQQTGGCCVQLQQRRRVFFVMHTTGSRGQCEAAVADGRAAETFPSPAAVSHAAVE